MNLSNSYQSKAAKKAYDAARYVELKHTINHRNKLYRIAHPNESAAYTRKWKEKRMLELGREKMNEHFSKSAQRWRTTPVNRLKTLITAARVRARTKALPFSLCIEDLLPPPTHCPALGIKINYAGQVQHGFVNDSPSLDRIKPSLGYVKGNVRVISWRANRIKSDATLEELQKIVSYAAQQ